MLRWLFAFMALSAPVSAAECRDVEFEDSSYSVCEVDPTRETLRLFLRDEQGDAFGQFGSINAMLGDAGQTLGFAMNAGMYHEDRSPVGLYIENGAQEMRLVTNAGPGNFGLLPNGVFCIDGDRVYVIESLKFEAQQRSCPYATQSGPMLVIDGDLHPRFLPDSDSRYVRNGVGTSDDGTTAIFAISNNAVTFHEFGRFFRDELGLPQALYFDGNVSRLYAPGLDRHDGGRILGPIVGTVISKPE